MPLPGVVGCIIFGVLVGATIFAVINSYQPHVRHESPVHENGSDTEDQSRVRRRKIKKKFLSENELCAICQYRLSSDLQSLKCGHYLHKYCYHELCKSAVKNVCPLCRIPFGSNVL